MLSFTHGAIHEQESTEQPIKMGKKEGKNEREKKARTHRNVARTQFDSSEKNNKQTMKLQWENSPEMTRFQYTYYVCVCACVYNGSDIHNNPYALSTHSFLLYENCEWVS